MTDHPEIRELAALRQENEALRREIHDYRCTQEVMDAQALALKEERDEIAADFADAAEATSVEVCKWRNRAEAAERALSEVRGALRECHGAMVTWFSSEYAEHPIARRAAALLYGPQGGGQ